MSNAAKFTSKGEVSLDVRLIARENERYHLSFSVQDTGIGMTRSRLITCLSHLYKETAVYPPIWRHGLGLSIVKSLVDMMDGKIQVFSTPGVGSTFIIHLSLDIDREKEESSQGALPAIQLKDIRVLVLEKSVEDMNLIGSYLKNFGLQYELTSSQASAVSMLEDAGKQSEELFDLFILDYNTPRKVVLSL